jgi:hypothetical protein
MQHVFGSLTIMAQAIENLTTIIGTILSLASHPTLPDYTMLILRLEETRPVEGKADLISNQLGNQIRVAVRNELLSDTRPGARMRCRAKRTPDGAMCEPHPEEGGFAILPQG